MHAELGTGEIARRFGVDPSTVRRAAHRFGIELPVRRLFDHTTLAELTEAIDGELGEAPSAPDGSAGADGTGTSRDRRP